MKTYGVDVINSQHRLFCTSTSSTDITLNNINGSREAWLQWACERKLHFTTCTIQMTLGSRFEKGIWDMQVFCKRPWGEESTGGWWMGRAAPLASWACGPPELLPSLRTMIQVQHVILELYMQRTHVQKQHIIASSLTVAFACSNLWLLRHNRSQIERFVSLFLMK